MKYTQLRTDFGVDIVSTLTWRFVGFRTRAAKRSKLRKSPFGTNQQLQWQGVNRNLQLSGGRQGSKPVNICIQYQHQVWTN